MTASTPNQAESDNSVSAEEIEEPLGLDQDETAVLRFVQKHKVTTQSMLVHRLRIPKPEVNSILRVLAAYDLVVVKPGYRTLKVRSPW